MIPVHSKAVTNLP